MGSMATMASQGLTVQLTRKRNWWTRNMTFPLKRIPSTTLPKLCEYISAFGPRPLNFCPQASRASTQLFCLPPPCMYLGAPSGHHFQL